jgi:putative endonuclease
MQYYTYMVMNKTKTVIYTGITNDLLRRMKEHKEGSTEGFTKKYRLNQLVWYAVSDKPEDAIRLEKRIKGWTRNKKIGLIRGMNPQFKDLTEILIQ